jgi:hypothetical protein
VLVQIQHSDGSSCVARLGTAHGVQNTPAARSVLSEALSRGRSARADAPGALAAAAGLAG